MQIKTFLGIIETVFHRIKIFQKFSELKCIIVDIHPRVSTDRFNFCRNNCRFFSKLFFFVVCQSDSFPKAKKQFCSLVCFDYCVVECNTLLFITIIIIIRYLN